MDPDGRPDLESRVARLEAELASIRALLEERAAARASGAAPPRADRDAPSREDRTASAAHVGDAARRADRTPDAGASSAAAGGTQRPLPWEVPAGPKKRRGWLEREFSGPQDWGLRNLFAPGDALLSRLGIGLLILSVAFFFKYSVDQGWLVPAVRIAIGVATGGLLVFLGANGAARGRPLGTALVGGAIATFFITGYAAHQWYSLIPYWGAFGMLVAASALGIGFSLRSDRQPLALVGLVGALSTPYILTPVVPRLGGLVAYVCVVALTVGIIYLARGFMLLMLMAALATASTLVPAIEQARGDGGQLAWVAQVGILVCGLVFWLVPLAQSLLHQSAAERWPRPSSVPIPWGVHHHVLAVLVPLTAVPASAALWPVEEVGVGWMYLGAAAFAFAIHTLVARRPDREHIATTHLYLAYLLALAGVALVLDGDVRYLTYLAVAVVTAMYGTARRSATMARLAHIAMVVVAGLFLGGFTQGYSLYAGDLTSLVDVAALLVTVLVGTRGYVVTEPDPDSRIARLGFHAREPEVRGLYLFAAYAGLLALTVRELTPLEHGPALASLGLGMEGAAVLIAGFRRESDVLQKVGMATLFLVVGKLLIVDLAAVDPIWRVLLFSVIGVLFLVLSRVAQERRER